MTNIVIATPLLSDNYNAIVVNNEISTLPGTNLFNTQLSNKWRTSGLTGMYIDIDFGSASSFNFVGLFGTNGSSSATWQVTAGATQGASTYDSGSMSLWASSGLSNWASTNAMHYISGGVSYRWVRVSITDGSNPDGYFQAGRLYISNAWIPTYNLTYGWSIEWGDNSIKSKSIGGNTYTNIKDRFRILNFDLSFETESDMYSNAFEIDRLRGQSEDIFVSKNISDTTYRHAQSIYGVILERTPIINPIYSVFSKRYTVEELL